MGEGKVRCEWAIKNPELTNYHDKEWGIPQHSDRRHFEALSICIMHAGLGWIPTLRKLPLLRKAFDNFEPTKVAKYTHKDFERLMNAEGVIHNGQKLDSILHNAQKFVAIQKQFGSFDKYLWQFTAGMPVKCVAGKCPSKGKEAEALSDDLKSRGFKFVGVSTATGLMEDVGLINHHMRLENAKCFLA